MSRSPNAFHVPATLCIGINLQKGLSTLDLFYAYKSKFRSQFYALNAVAMCFNLIAILLGAVQLDYLNSPFSAPRGFLFHLILTNGVFNNLVALILLYVLHARLMVFYKVSIIKLVENACMQVVRSFGDDGGACAYCEFLLYHPGS
jgi:uncharacterized membrane protein YesL